MALRNVYPFLNRQYTDLGLARFEWVAAQAAIGLAKDSTAKLWQLEERAKLAVQAATELTEAFRGISNQRQWPLLSAYPLTHNGRQRSQFNGLTVQEYTVGRLLTGALRRVTPQTPTSVTAACHMALRYGRVMADTLSIAPNRPAFAQRHRHDGLCQRDRLEIETLSQMLQTVDVDSDAYRVACDAMRVIKPLGYLPPTDKNPDGLPKRDFFIEKLAPALVNHDCLSLFDRLTKDWEQAIGSTSERLTIAEWSVATIAGGLLSGIHPEDEIPDSIVTLAVERYDALLGVLGEWGFDIYPHAPVYATANDQGIDDYSWLAAQILGELARFYGVDVSNPEIVRGMAEYAAEQSQMFWLELANQEREYAESLATAKA